MKRRPTLKQRVAREGHSPGELPKTPRFPSDRTVKIGPFERDAKATLEEQNARAEKFKMQKRAEARKRADDERRRLQAGHRNQIGYRKLVNQQARKQHCLICGTPVLDFERYCKDHETD